MSDQHGDGVECLLCGHEGHEDDGVYDPVDGDWYCDVCAAEAPGSELPLVTDGGREQHTEGTAQSSGGLVQFMKSVFVLMLPMMVLSIMIQDWKIPVILMLSLSTARGLGYLQFNGGAVDAA